MTAEIAPAASRDIAALAEPVLVRLAAYWQTLRREGALPRRRDINPAAIVRAMPFVALIDVERHHPLEMRFRLFGTELARWAGHDNTGRAIEDCYRDDLGRDWDQALRDYERAVLTGVPARRRHRGERPNGLFVDYERILLPLASDGRTVDGLLMGMVPH